jgi:hypothetical protein
MGGVPAGEAALWAGARLQLLAYQGALTAHGHQAAERFGKGEATMPAITIEGLLAMEEIRQLKARYCRFVDTKQWDRLAGLFAPDARLDGLGSAPDGSDSATFVAGISRRLARVISIHRVHSPEISLTASDRARGIWPMMDYLEFPEAERPAEAPGSRGFRGYGFYEEEYQRIDGRWLIAYLRLTRLRIDALPADPPVATFGRHKPTPGWL